MSQSVTANRAESSAVDARNAHAQDFEKKAFRFRILVVGRANAGKTTILQKVCNTTEEPEIYDAKGEKIESSVIAPTLMRGQHDIENEMVFLSNPGFVFHDSRGFEAGGVDEFDAVKAFIAERSQKRKLSDQLHATMTYGGFAATLISPVTICDTMPCLTSTRHALVSIIA